VAGKVLLSATRQLRQASRLLKLNRLLSAHAGSTNILALSSLHALTVLLCTQLSLNMSFRAIYTDKNGNKRLIKVPWYAALAGAPNPKPRYVDPVSTAILLLSLVNNHDALTPIGGEKVERSPSEAERERSQREAMRQLWWYWQGLWQKCRQARFQEFSKTCCAECWALGSRHGNVYSCRR
jgi:hypothetical protein